MEKTPNKKVKFRPAEHYVLAGENCNYFDAYIGNKASYRTVGLLTSLKKFCNVQGSLLCQVFLLCYAGHYIMECRCLPVD